MKTFYKTLFYISLVVLTSASSVGQIIAQEEFFISAAENLIRLEVVTVWGDLHVIGEQRDSIWIDAEYENKEGRYSIPPERFNEFFSIRERMGYLAIVGRQPKSFESIHFTLRIPQGSDVFLAVERGGEIRVEKLYGLVEVDHRNGSVKLDDLCGHAVIHAANGSIEASFKEVTSDKSMSFVTLNGGIKLTFPQDLKADLHARSQKNGFFRSDFEVGKQSAIGFESDETIPLEISSSKDPVRVKGTINGGGPLVFTLTENGPIEIKKRLTN